MTLLVLLWGLCAFPVTVLSHSCQTLDLSTFALKLNTTCYDVVDYPFYLPTGMTAHSLNVLATAKLSDTRLNVLPGACQAALKKLVCSSVYLKCVPNVNLLNPVTWSNSIYAEVNNAFRLPFQRPCMKLCSDVAPSCFNLLSLIGLNPNCNATFDYSSGNVLSPIPKQFDATNDATYCNSAPAPVKISSTREVYLEKTKGACAGILDEIWVPPGNLVSSLLAPMQPPYQVQLAIEYELQKNFAQIPPNPGFDACRYAMRKHFCSSYFLRPQFAKMANVLADNGIGAGMIGYLTTVAGINASFLAHSFYLPSYPHKNICLDFKATCGVIFGINPALTPNCNSISNITGQPNFPTGNQSISSLALTTNLGTTTVQFNTSANKLVNAVDNHKQQVVSPAGSCAMLTFSSPQDALHYVCAGAVDYPFYLPYGVTAKDLNQLAISKLNSSELSMLPVMCNVALKRAVCASVYLKCPTSLVVSNLVTWNYDIYNDLGVPFPLPFQRPCRSLCVDVKTKCLGLLELVKLAPDCAATIDYSGGLITLGKPYQFDASDNTQKCNAAPAMFTVASSMEPYIHANDNLGACSGIVKKVFVPPGPRVDPSIAPLQPPYAIQTAIESQLADSFKKLPPWLAPECRFALRKHFCSISLLAPQPILMSTALAGLSPYYPFLAGMGVDVTSVLSHKFYLPSYPEKEVCLDYESKCFDFISSAGAKQPKLLPDCDGTDPVTGLKLHPVVNQTIGSLKISLIVGGAPTQVPVTFATQPASYAESRDISGYITTCPKGFVVPEDPSDEDIRWITGSGCSMKCFRSAVWTEEEWSYFEGVVKIVSIVGLILVIFLLVVWLTDYHLRKQYLVISFGMCSLIATLTLVSSAYKYEESMFCRSNAVELSGEDGPTFCAVQSVLLTYSGLGCCLAWTFISLELYLRIILLWRTDDHWKIFVPLTFTLPLIAVIAHIATGFYGFNTKQPWCFFGLNSPKNGSTWIFYLPILVITIIGLGLLFRVIVYIVGVSIAGTSRNGQSIDPSSDISTQCASVGVTRLPTMFVISCLVVWVTLFGFKAQVYQDEEKVNQSFKDWTRCVFQYFDGSDESFVEHCGERAEFHYNLVTVGWVLFCAAGQSIFVSLIFLPGYFHSRCSSARVGSEQLTASAPIAEVAMVSPEPVKEIAAPEPPPVKSSVAGRTNAFLEPEPVQQNQDNKAGGDVEYLL